MRKRATRVDLQQQSVAAQHDIVHLQQIADLMWQASKETFFVVATQKFTVVCVNVPPVLFATTKRCRTAGHCAFATNCRFNVAGR